MKCIECGIDNKNDAKFCKQCGKKFTNDSNLGSVDMYFHKKNNSCQVCHNVSAELRQIEFHENIGMLVGRRYKSIKGMLCNKCIDDYFWKFTLTTLFLGWWGTISFFVTPFILIGNVFRYLFALNMKTGN